MTYSLFSKPGFGKVQKFDLEVHKNRTRIATSPDFLRLVPPIPLAHGAVFSTSKFKSSEWIVEIAMRVHGSIRGGSKGGRGLGFWYTRVSMGGDAARLTWIY